MDIIQRNLFRLLRSGTFNSDEKLEAMSAFKWDCLYQLAIMHEVIPYAYKGILNCKSQFFLHLTDKQWKEWQKAANKAKNRKQDMNEEEDDFLRPDHLTNPVLNHKLQDILDDEHSNTTTRHLLLLFISIVRHILNEGMPIHQLLELGIFLRHEGSKVDFQTLGEWISSLNLSQMCQLEGQCLILLYGFQADELPFMKDKKDKRVESIAQELLEFTDTRSQDWYFSQDEDSIFVHNSNTSAMFSHIRRSARYFRYFPSESLTNFFASFVHSLSHIEE
ncbi:MAG: hypothetical protein IJQ13_08225 [Prevotella sp.]|nr:hypothetical protein [Prevotella sp.]